MQSAPVSVRLDSGGDGGNRTRVRKIKPANIYERSRLFLLTGWPTHDKGFTQPAARARKPFFRAFSGVPHGTPAL